MSYLRKLRDDERGQDLIEYALLAGFVALIATTVFPSVPTSMSQIFTKVSDKLTLSGG
jgi:Flp pilus assembly pilin Flp